METRDRRSRSHRSCRDGGRGRLPEGILELLLAGPRVRPGVVPRTKALLASRVLPPTAIEVAGGVVDRLVAERIG